MPASFVHLHVHTENSMLDGLGGIKDDRGNVGYVTRGARLGMPALAMTDHGNIFGAPEFYKECRKQGVEPIIGCEFYFVNDADAVRGEKDRDRSHITVLARGARGYEVLAELNTATWEQFYYKPLLDRKLCEALGDDAEHLTVLSGCAGSQLSRHLLEEKEDEAIEELTWWRETFPHYYIELMHHNTAFDRRLNDSLITFGQRYSIPWVITNDPHYVEPHEHADHDALLAIQTASDIAAEDRFRFDGSGYWLKSRPEMRRTFRQYGDEVWKPGAAMTLQIAKESHTRIKAWETKTWQIPHFPDVEDSYAELKRRVYRRMRELGHRDDPVRLEQVRTELRTIRKTGIADFLLITEDAISYARSEGIRVGPGRGSVAGTLVGYYLGIHKVDPIKHKLLFERFLNPERPKMPDIDTDFSQARRGEVVQYTIDKYGEDNTMAVAAFGRMRTASAFNSLAKAYGIGYMDAQEMNKRIHDEEDEEGNLQLVIPEGIEAEFPEMCQRLRRLVGIKQRISRHPAGLIIAAPEANIRRQIPQMVIASSGKWVGQFDKKAVEAMGLMKQDFLGLRTLDTIDIAVRLIEQRQGITLEPDDWNPDEEPGDDEVYAMLADGRTAGVFQMEGSANQRGCRDVKPSCFEDLVSITSLYRTGAISAGFPKIFNSNRQRGKRHIEYLHPKLKPLLEETWGVVLYQEQVMEFGRTLAGFNMVQVDEIKEAIKDKSSENMMAMKPLFIDGCQSHSGISRNIGQKIWKMIEGYAGYGYNRSHAVAYTLLTYQTARLKKFYPIEYTCALLRTVPNDKSGREKRDTYLTEAMELGVKIKPPDINLSEIGATPDWDPSVDIIRFGFSDLKGIGEKQAVKIMQGRSRAGGRYEEVDEVASEVRNEGVMKVLTAGRAFESIGVDGDQDKCEELLGWQFRDVMLEYRQEYHDEIVLPSETFEHDRRCCIVGQIIRAEQRTSKKSGNDYMTWKIKFDQTQSFDIQLWSDTQDKLWHLQPGSVVMVRGDWDPKWLNISTGNYRMVKILKRVTRQDAA